MGYQLSQHFARAGAEVTVLTGEDEDGPEFDAQQSFPIRRIPIGATDTRLLQARQKPALLRAVATEVKNANPDRILCLHWDPCAYLARMIRRIDRRRPYYLVAHGMELMQLPRGKATRWAKTELRAFALNGAREIFAVSNYTRDRVISLGVDPNLVQVIPNGVTINGNGESSVANGSGKATKTLLTVSRLVPRKGHDSVLRALPRVLKRIPDVIYRVAGEGPERERLESLARELGIEKRVEFFGRVNEGEKDRLFKDCDLFVLPCRESETDFEGFGIALLEAMSYQKLVIAGRTGGVPDVVSHGETGFLVDPDDIDALADRIVQALENPADSERLGRNALQRVREQFSWEAVSQRYLAAMT